MGPIFGREMVQVFILSMEECGIFILVGAVSTGDVIHGHSNVTPG
jgi:hypothetical protein